MELRNKLKEFESRILEAQSNNLSRIEHNKDTSLMTIDGGLDRINSSMMSTTNKEQTASDFTVMFLRD